MAFQPLSVDSSSLKPFVTLSGFPKQIRTHKPYIVKRGGFTVQTDLVAGRDPFTVHIRQHEWVPLGRSDGKSWQVSRQRRAARREGVWRERPGRLGGLFVLIVLRAVLEPSWNNTKDPESIYCFMCTDQGSLEKQHQEKATKEPGFLRPRIVQH